VSKVIHYHTCHSSWWQMHTSAVGTAHGISCILSQTTAGAKTGLVHHARCGGLMSLLESAPPVLDLDHI